MTKIYSTLALLVFCTLALSQEICDNGIDDDGDGLIDLNDPDDTVQKKCVKSGKLLNLFYQIKFIKYGLYTRANYGTYILKIEFKETMSDKKHTYSGHVNIIR